MAVIGKQEIILSDEQLKASRIFAYESAKSQQQIEFGSHDTKPRTVLEIARDNLIGKLAEVAFAEFIGRCFGIKTELDFNIYPRGVWDKDDFELMGKLVDIKATRPGGRWLLVELSKLEFRRKENKLPDYFMFAVTGWKKSLDEKIENERATGRVQLMGYAALDQICHAEEIGNRNEKICRGITNTLFLPKGSMIPNTNTPLQADNCGRLVAHLETNWTNLIESLK